MPGLNIPHSSDTRTGHGDAITTKNLHNELMRKLYDRLCSENGKDNVGTEIRGELNELMLLLKVATSTISTKSRQPLTHLIVLQRH